MPLRSGVIHRDPELCSDPLLSRMFSFLPRHGSWKVTGILDEPNRLVLACSVSNVVVWKKLCIALLSQGDALGLRIWMELRTKGSGLEEVWWISLSGERGVERNQLFVDMLKTVA